MRATRDSYRNEPMPEQRTWLVCECHLNEPEYRALVRGLIPQSQDDRWLVFEEDGWLYLHRSWTGHCIYALRLESRGDGWVVTEVWGNGDPEQYAATNEAHEVRRLDRLLNVIIDENTQTHSEGDEP